jgi:hypothetical protein
MEVSLLEDLCNGVFVEFPNYMLRVGLGFEDALTLVSKDGEPLAELTMTDGAESPVQGFYLEWADFLRQCRTGEPSAIDAVTVRHTTALIEAGARQRVPTTEQPRERQEVWREPALTPNDRTPPARGAANAVVQCGMGESRG